MGKENESEANKNLENDEADERKVPASFVVRDRRRFDSEGNSVADSESAKPTVPTTTTTTTSQPPVAEEHILDTDMGVDDDPDYFIPDEPLGDEGSVASFSGFVMSFATQAMMQMGEMDPPPGMGIEKDLPGAQQTIDILSMLQGKTKGNLSAAENRLMEDILHNLRITFVRQSRA